MRSAIVSRVWLSTTQEDGKAVAVFSRALFQVAKRVATGNLVKTVTFPTSKPPNQVA